MPTSGGTTGTTVGGGAIGLGIAAPLQYTHLSPNRYAKLLQINPAHFNGLASATIFPLENRCSDVWFRYDWQATDSISWESLVQQIAEAEADIKDYLRYSVAPDWEVKDPRPWQAHHNRLAYGGGINVYGEPLAIPTSYDYVIAPGQRAVSIIGSAKAVAYSDPDGDGYNELATVTSATTLTDVKEIKVYHTGKEGERDWEVRPIRSKSISGGIVTITFDAWVLVSPDKRELPPTSSGVEALDLLSSANYVGTVDVYREYTDTTSVSAELFWATDCGICGGTGCTSCQLSTTTGCARITSVKPGFVQALPATYSDDAWAYQVWPTGADPLQVLLWYQAGYQSNRFLAGTDYDPLDQSMAQCIAWLATARLERPFCGCGTSQSLAAKLMTDMAISGENESKNSSFEDLENPFGTRLGEIWAWRRLKKLRGKPLGGYAI